MTRFSFAVLVALAVLCGRGAAAEAPATGRLELRGKTHENTTLVSLGSDRCAWRDADGEPIEIPTAEVVAWGRPPAWPIGPHVLLADGSVIAGRPIEFNERHVVIQSAPLGRRELPASAFVGYRRTAASRPAAITAGDRPSFAIEFDNRDRLTATMLAIADGQATIGWAGGTVELPLTDIQSIDAWTRARPPATDAFRARILVALDDGSRFPLSAFGPLDPELPVAVAVDGGCATSLADLEPLAIDHAPTIAAPRPLTVGRTLADEWPAARGRTAFTAIGIHAPARVTYRLPAPAAKFESTVAIDDSAGKHGSVVVRILARADASEPREAFVSPVIRGGEDPLDIRVALPGAREITLVVEPAAGGELIDRTIWLDPRTIAIE
jgi:hypothetical protein